MISPSTHAPPSDFNLKLTRNPDINGRNVFARGVKSSLAAVAAPSLSSSFSSSQLLTWKTKVLTGLPGDV